MIKTLYAIPWYKCNLKCPHCDVRDTSVDFQPEKFIEALNKVEAKRVILFGGEPLLFPKWFEEILDTNKVNSISTNLLLLSPHLLHEISIRDISIATSWNPNRFTPDQWETWLTHCAYVTWKDIPLKVLITLTPDLFNMPKGQLWSIFENMEKCAGIKSFLFESLIGPECNDKADSWLCKFHKWYKEWGFTMTNELETRLNNWMFNCNETYTMLPDGSVKRGCPQYKEPHILNKCINCEYNSICQPCMLQKTCSYPKKLAKLIRMENS